MRRVSIILAADMPHYATDGLFPTPFARCVGRLTVYTSVACFNPLGETCRSPTTSSLTHDEQSESFSQLSPRYLKPVNWLSLAHRLSPHVACGIPQVLVRVLATTGRLWINGQYSPQHPRIPWCGLLRNLVHFRLSFRDPIPYSTCSYNSSFSITVTHPCLFRLFSYICSSSF